ncbi:hypothetical protein AB1L88_21100 [Tautonia sp. JC769]|uniref:hypothetical protein n=1 Tax=Tautonia sp. JC769 TaxID=3232135 RepID=UPI003459D72D
MPVLTPKARHALMLAALLGCALALGPARDATAASCHVDDRPVFGLSNGPNEHQQQHQVTIADTVIVEASSAPLELERRCPSNDPDRPPSRSLVSAGDSSFPLPARIDPIEQEPSTLLRPGPASARPIRRCARIDRPPRSR